MSNRMPAGRYDEVIARDQYCQASAYGLSFSCSGGPEVHHRMPRGMGGTTNPAIHDLDNLVLLCQGHHQWVESNRAMAYDLGLLVRRQVRGSAGSTTRQTTTPDAPAPQTCRPLRPPRTVPGPDPF